MSVQRQFDHGFYGHHTKTLDAVNNSMPGNSFLHATKGFRSYSTKRGKAALITAEMKIGKFPLAIRSWETIKQMLLTEDAI